jgi:D-tyrosyl-tRNA(Tyr) deacylase
MFAVPHADREDYCGRAEQPFLPAVPAGATQEAQREKACHSAQTADARTKITMRAILQRVTRARVTVEGQVAGEIGAGLLVLLGVLKHDTPADAALLAEKTAQLRIFNDAQGKMNLSLLDVHGTALVVSQFTLCADTTRGRRPSFERAAAPGDAKCLYEEYVRCLQGLGVRVETGVFQAHMEVELVNDGPVTVLLNSEKTGWGDSTKQ